MTIQIVSLFFITLLLIYRRDRDSIEEPYHKHDSYGSHANGAAEPFAVANHQYHHIGTR